MAEALLCHRRRLGLFVPAAANIPTIAQSIVSIDGRNSAFQSVSLHNSTPETRGARGREAGRRAGEGDGEGEGAGAGGEEVSGRFELPIFIATRD